MGLEWKHWLLHPWTQSVYIWLNNYLYSYKPTKSMNSDVSVILKYFAYAKYIINYIKFNVDFIQLKCILLLN